MDTTATVKAMKLVSTDVYLNVGELIDLLITNEDYFDKLMEIPEDTLEYWAVSDILGYQLEGQGEHVLHLLNMNIWCRQISGQTISMDSVIHALVTSS